jgi:hypothetical protein
LERNDRVVFFSPSVLGEQRVHIVGETRENGVLEDLDGWDFEQVEVRLSFALESVDDVLMKLVLHQDSGCSPNNINRSPAKFKEIVTR